MISDQDAVFARCLVEPQPGIVQTRFLGFPSQLEHLIPIGFIPCTRAFSDLAVALGYLGL